VPNDAVPVGTVAGVQFVASLKLLPGGAASQLASCAAAGAAHVNAKSHAAKPVLYIDSLPMPRSSGGVLEVASKAVTESRDRYYLTMANIILPAICSGPAPFSPARSFDSAAILHLGDAFSSALIFWIARRINPFCSTS
jgi:hypothetical protein